MGSNAVYVVAGYAITALALGGYTLWLFARASAARARAASVAERRQGRGR